METIQQHFKSDFKVFIDSEAGWGVPFILKFWTNAPSRPYIASYDGANFTNCHIMDDGRLCVSFDNHHLGLGILMYQPTFFIDDECFRTGVCDESVPAAPLVVKDAPVVEDFGHDYFRLQTECTVLIPQGAVSMSYPGLVYASSPITLKAGDVAECKFDEYSLFGTQEGFYKKKGERYSFVARRSYTAEEDIELFIAYPSSENHVIPTAKITHEGSDRTITLSLNGSNQLVTYGTLPAFYMKGERGDTGERGAQGPKGDKGDTGATGATGPKGETGPQGQQGIQGVQGPKGETGATGPKGERGLQGEKGEPFRYTDFTPEQLEGLRGPRGYQGETGPAGPVGPQGERGPKGDSVTMFPAVTIFGQPTIQETQMSGFTAENYAQFPFMVDFAGRTWRIDFAITTGADVSQQHNIFDSAFGLAFAFKSGKFLLAMSSNGTSWNLGATSGTHDIAANTTYYIRITWDGTAYVLAYSTDKVSWTNDITVTSSESLASKQIIIGKSLDNAHIFNGSINFAEARLTIANVIVWEGMEEVGTATRMALDMSNIDEAGKQRVNDIVKAGSLGAEVTALDLKVGEINATLGQYAERASVLLEVGMDNMAIDAATGKPVAKSGWAISKPFTIQRGNEYLVKVGQTDGSVWAAAEQSIYEWDEVIVDEETGEETIVHHTDISYSKKVQLNAGAELPLDGYLRILGMPNDFDIVVSYHKASADTTIKVRRDGLTANICTQVGNQEAEQSDALNELDERASEAANAKRDSIDVVNDYLANGYPTTLYGHGTPSASVLPLNLPKHLPWGGTPEHIAQRYINVDAASGGLYYAKPTLNTFGYITAYTWAQA